MKRVHLLGAALFVWSAGLQLNDPDPYGWIALYLCAALAALGAGLGRPAPWVARLLTLVALAWALVIALGLQLQVPVWAAVRDWQMRSGGNEEVRELGGLAIVAVWMAIIGRPIGLKAGLSPAAQVREPRVRRPTEDPTVEER